MPDIDVGNFAGCGVEEDIAAAPFGQEDAGANRLGRADRAQRLDHERRRRLGDLLACRGVAQHDLRNCEQTARAENQDGTEQD